MKDADCCIIVTEWGEFKTLTPEDHAKHETVHPDRWKKNLQSREYSQKLEFAAVGLGE